jgi:hypothetical protein
VVTYTLAIAPILFSRQGGVLDGALPWQRDSIVDDGSPRDLIFRQRPRVEVTRNVATANVDLPQSLDLDDRQLTHDRFGRSARDAEFGREVARVEQFRERLAHDAAFPFRAQ